MIYEFVVRIPSLCRTIIRKKIYASKTAEGLKAVEREIKEESNNTGLTATNGGCADGQNCQRIVSEAELSNLLAQDGM